MSTGEDEDIYTFLADEAKKAQIRQKKPILVEIKDLETSNILLHE